MYDITLEELWTRNSSIYDREKKYVAFKMPDKIDFLKEKLKEVVPDEKALVYYGSPDFAEKKERDLSLFEEIINHKPGLTDKDVSIDRKTGDIRVKMFGKDDMLLPIEKLSSGEKNWLLINFYLIFYAKYSRLILIDEPEVSLHPEWLINFKDNVERIFEGQDNQIIIATHSPSITYYSSDLMTEVRRG